MANISTYMEKRNESLIALKPLKIILNKNDFDNGISSEINDKIETFGIFKITSLDEKDKFDCKFPIIIQLNINIKEKVDDKVVLIYEANDIIIDKMGFSNGAKQANKFLDLLITGKFEGLTQEDLVNIFLNNMKLNGASLGVQSEIVEAMVSELVRWKKDPSVPFRMKTGKNSDDEFEFMSIKDVARASNVFNTLAFEDVKKALQSSVLMTRKKQKQKQSPIEKFI